MPEPPFAWLIILNAPHRIAKFLIAAGTTHIEIVVIHAPAPRGAKKINLLPPRLRVAASAEQGWGWGK